MSVDRSKKACLRCVVQLFLDKVREVCINSILKSDMSRLFEYILTGWSSTGH